MTSLHHRLHLGWGFIWSGTKASSSQMKRNIKVIQLIQSKCKNKDCSFTFLELHQSSKGKKSMFELCVSFNDTADLI